MFRVAWPGFARLEAVLLFAASVLAVGEWGPAQAWVRGTIAPALAGWFPAIPQATLAWAAMAVLLAAPFLCVLIVIDRLLAVRKGFAILSVLAIAAWAGLAAILADELGVALPGSASTGLSSPEIAAAAVLALILHMAPLRRGLADRGFVGIGLQANSGPVFTLNPRGRVVAGEPGHEGTPVLPGLVLVAVAACVLLGVLFRGEIAERLARAPLAPASAASDDPSIKPSEDGARVFEAVANGGQTIQMVADPSVPGVLLRAEDASRLGLAIGRAEFSDHIVVSNQRRNVATVTLPALTIGQVTQRNVPVYVARPGTLDRARLGRPFTDHLTAPGPARPDQRRL